MSVINQFNLYSVKAQKGNIGLDKVDELIKGIQTKKDFIEVKDYITENFGNIQGWKLYDYPDLEKRIAITIEDEKITFCVAKKGKQYYGKYWKLINKKKN